MQYLLCAFFVEIVDSTRPTPSQQQIDCFERFIPSKNIHLGFLRSRINVYPSTHCKAGNLSNASTGSISVWYFPIYQVVGISRFSTVPYNFNIIMIKNYHKNLQL